MTDSPRFRTLYLHIGLGKTGTTSVQRELAGKAGELESHCHLHFPTRLSQWKHFRGNHSDMLRALFAQAPRPRRRLATLGLNDDDDIAAYNARNQRDLVAGFAESTARDLLLSDEVVAHFEPVDLAALAEWCRGLAAQVVVLACIRHPVHALSSEIQQRLRIGAKLENLYRNPPHYRFRELFGNLGDAFGQDSLHIYSYHSAAEHPGGLASALLAQCGIDAGGLLAPQPAENVRMSREAALLLSAYNHEFPAFIMGRRNPDRAARIVRTLASIPGHKYQAPAEALSLVEQLTAGDVAWLQSQFGLLLAYPPVEPGDTDPLFSAESLRALALAIAGQPGKRSS
jgi:hypothetical protein